MPAFKLSMAIRPGTTVKVFQRVPMAGQPGGDGLVGDEFYVEMAAA